MNKFLTVIIRVYNREKSIVKCINSVLSQTGIDDVQILIINDCSSDNTLNIITKIKNENPNVCIDIVSHYKNMGRGKALNTAKCHIKGKYCQILDSDDEWINNNHVQELKDKLNNTNYKVVCRHPNNLHVYNTYLSKLFKECHINNINYFEDHYTIEIFNKLTDNEILFFENNYYRINKNSEDRENKEYISTEQFYNAKLFHLYEDVFYFRNKHDDFELKRRCDEFPIEELSDVLLESYNEVKEELIKNPIIERPLYNKYNLIDKTLGLKISEIYTVVKIPNINLIIAQSLSFNTNKSIEEYKDILSINSKYDINVDDIKRYRPQQAICIIQDPIERLLDTYYKMYKENYNTLDDFIEYVKLSFSENKNELKPQFKFFNLNSIDEFIMFNDYKDWCIEHNIEILQDNIKQFNEEVSESSKEIIKELYKDDYILINIIKDENKLYIK